MRFAKQYEDGFKECPDCGGEGFFYVSECCNAPIIHGDICSNCGEHAGMSNCSTCAGTGSVPLTEAELDSEAESANIAFGEMMNDN